MSKFKKILFWSIFSFGTACIILLGTFLLSFERINQESIKKEILTSVSTKLGGELKFQGLGFKFLPQPHILMREARLSIPGNISGTLQSLHVYPEILPLIIGRISIKKLKLAKPEFNVTLQANPRPVGYQEKIPGYKTIKESVSRALTFEMFKSSGLVIVIDDGKISTYKNKEPFTRYSGIKARIRRKSDTLYLDAKCHSNISKEISLTAQMKSQKFEIRGQLQLRDVNPQFLFDMIKPKSRIKVRDSRNDLYLSFNTPDDNLFQVNIAGNIRRLLLQRNKDKTTIKSRFFEIKLKSGIHRASFELTRLNMENPKLNLTGAGFIDWKNKKSQLEFIGRNILTEPLRKKVLLVAGENRIIQYIAGIIKKGRVPEIKITSHGTSVSELGKFANIRIRGSMVDGNIFVPEILLDLKNTNGKVDIKGGILHGNNLTASLVNTQGREGKLKIGLMGKKDIPFHLDIMLQADLSQLPPILKRLVKHDRFQEELSQIKSLNGRAMGRLILGDTLDSIKTRVYVEEAELTAEYQGIPDPIKISKGALELDEKKIALNRLDGAIGDSSFSELSLEIQFENPYQMEFQAHGARLNLKENHKWLNSYESLGPFLKEFNVLDGNADLSDFKIRGPLFTFNEWVYQAESLVEGLVLKSAMLPEPLTIEEGKIEVRKKKAGNLSKTLIFINPAYMKYKDRQLALNGDIGISDKKINLNLDLTADRFSWDMFNKIMTYNKDVPQEEKKWSILGDISLKTGRFEYNKLSLEPFQADIYIMPNNILMDITRAELCGISIPGSMKIQPAEMELFLTPKSQKQSLADVLNCIWNEDKLADGIFDFDGELRGKANQEKLAQAIQGNLQFQSNSGRIYRIGLLAKIFAILNVTEIFKGKLPDLVKEGFAYQSIKSQGEVKQGKLILKDCVIDGSSMTIFFEGEIDMLKEELNLVVMVAPFKTIDSIIRYIPLIKDIMNGNLVSIPFQVTGNWSDYKVIPLPPKEIGNSMLGIMKRTLQAPIKIFQPVIQNGKKKQNQDDLKPDNTK